ncbi:hypothetical protein Acr_21g0004310 [Actinidia rufa]|uniref:FAR1 domain-containing protein n=1 Tax=Actinidia rufa TaxID=165716 RepID=A0A7J0GGH3_9ERIC|nr:hypothetical protein Acr_21g0004310 [Actinidia rufa]
MTVTLLVVVEWWWRGSMVAMVMMTIGVSGSGRERVGGYGGNGSGGSKGKGRWLVVVWQWHCIVVGDEGVAVVMQRWLGVVVVIMVTFGVNVAWCNSGGWRCGGGRGVLGGYGGGSVTSGGVVAVMVVVMVMSQLPSPSSLISLESVPSTMCPMSSQIEWDEEVESWSVDIGEEEDVSKESVTKDCVDSKEVNGDSKERVEEPKMGMEFDTHDEAYLYYTRFAKEKGFAVAKRSSKKGNDGMLKHVILQCSRGGKPRPRGSNPAKARPQCKVECPAHLNVIRTKEGKWRVSKVLLEHNHEQSPSKSRFFKSNRALDENVRRKLVLNEQAGIRLNKTVASLHIEAGGPDKVPYLPRDCRNYLDKLRRLQLAERDAEAMHRYFMRMRVYDSLTEEEFEKAWDVFMKKYDLQSNTWLHGLYLEKERWVPAYVKGMFWAGMSSTQRSESMNAYFDGYIHSKTTLKQFVEQYENALTQKVEIEKLADMKSWYSFILFKFIV